MKILFACGGTGGHMYPLIALYNEMLKRESCSNNEYLFVGSDYKKGQDKNIYNRENITSYRLIKSRGIKRKISLHNLNALFCNTYAFCQASQIIKEFKPDLVIGSGGYPSFHMISAAKHSKIPYVLLESNILPGLVVRLMYKEAALVVLNSNETLNYLKSSNNIKVLGSPSRDKSSFNTRYNLLKEFNLPSDMDKKIIVVIGGSCGSPKINESMIDIINNKFLNEYAIIWATGIYDYQSILKQINDFSNISLVEYIDDIPELLSIADIVIARAGAMSLLEIKAAKIPSVLVPMSDATENHQLINAKELEKLNVAKILTEDIINGTLLSSTIKDILDNPEVVESIKSIYNNMPSMANCNSTICDAILNLYSI